MSQEILQNDYARSLLKKNLFLLSTGAHDFIVKRYQL